MATVSVAVKAPVDRAEFTEFLLENVEQLGEDKILGIGSYGSVQEVKINGEVYAAKMIHEALLETDERGGVETVIQNYLRECRLMARIRHPNITQFIGLCFLACSRLPLLVMERLDSSLDDLLESTPNIPLSVSQYILVCVARGLLHLHRESVVHRDLTARNVLLTSSLSAKITDFGNSRIVDLDPGQLARTLTRFPGTQVYMPPEAVSDNGKSVYGPSLDVFSFGVLQLFVLTQVFPAQLLPPTYPDQRNQDLLRARSELERRGPYMALLDKNLLGGHGHPLFGLVRECLSNIPERRPTTANLLSSLEAVGREMEGGMLLHDIAQVKNTRAFKAKDKIIETLQREVVQQTNLLGQKDTMITKQQQDLSAKDGIIVAKDRDIAMKNKYLNQQAAQLAQKDDQLAQKDRSLATQETTISDLISQLSETETLIQALKEQVTQKDAELARRASAADDEDTVEKAKGVLYGDIENLSKELESKSKELAAHTSQILRISSNQFETFQKIGSGVFGEVLEGTVRVAAKRLHSVIASSHNLELFQREMTLLAEVRHPNLVQFIGAVLDQSPPFVITELLDINLSEAYKQNLLRYGNRSSIFIDVAKALDYLHQRYKPIIHRDVQTANILLQKMVKSRWKAKICDLGSANLLQNALSPGLGGILYTAPEAFSSDYFIRQTVRQTVKIDVYSFGIVLCEVTVSQFPTSDKYPSMIRQVQREHPPLYELIDRCTERDPNFRPTMAEALVELNGMDTF